MTTPTLVLFQFAFYGLRFNRKVLAAIGVTCFGVIIATFTDVQLRLVGFFVAAAAVVVTAVYQIVITPNKPSQTIPAIFLSVLFCFV